MLTAVAARTLMDFRGIHANDTIIVCGCGESLRRFEHPERFVTIGVNDVGRQFDPTYLVVLNPRRQFAAGRFEHVERSRAQFLFTQLDLEVQHPAIVRIQLGSYGGTSFRDPRVLHYTRNSPYVALCLAAHMGARQIGLIGIDFTDHHFFGATGQHPLTKRFATIDAEYRRLREALDAMNVRVVNLSPFSRLTAFAKGTFDDLGVRDSGLGTRAPGCSSNPGSRIPDPGIHAHRVVSYATTPVAGVPAILSRCIASQTRHTSRCVWATRSYGNGVVFEGDIEWSSKPGDAEQAIRAADVVIVHNGKVDPRHERMLDGKAVITLAHNYMWNVDPRFVQRGMPGLVVGQYQATLPEFAGWTAIPNPVPIWEPAHTPGEKGSAVTICYTPSGRHERYPPGHRLYWHGKGYETTMRVLERLSRAMPLRLEVIGKQQLSHAEALAMKRRAHIVIDECVTGSYHRNSLEGLATGCVVVNGVGLLPGVVDTFRRCAADADRVPFVFATLDTLEAVLLDLANRGADSLTVMGRENRAWMERHWSFSRQWARLWQPAIEAASARVTAASAAVRRAELDEQWEVEVHTPALDGVSVVVPHGGYERLPLLTATLVMLRQRPGVGEVIVAEMGRTPAAGAVAAQWADKHLFIQHDGPFERARALNAGAAVAECELVMWLDNDLLIPPSFVVESVKELRNRRLDYLVPYSSIRYLSELDSDAVIRGERNPLDCHASNTFRSSGRSGAVTLGGIGLVRRDFLQRHGGLIEGFRGWGGEDNAWNQKVSLLGRSAPTERTDQTVHHLFHPMSGGYHMAAAMADNPHYAENVALLQRVFSVREQTQFMRQFPVSAPAAGVLTRSHVVSGSNGRVVSGFSRTSDTPHDLPVWTYWEGPCPEWIRACLRTITSHAARVHTLDPKSFDQLWDRDRDINLSRLRPAHRADFVRAFLLHRYGGLWIDADCLVMHPLQPVLDLLQEHDFVGHRERAGLISNAFIAARRGSRIAGEFYNRVCHVLRSRKRLYWNALGADPLSAVVANDSSGWHELPCERVQPVCWSRPGEFFVERDHPDHDRVFDSQAVCYMLSNGAINNYIAAHRPPDLLSDRTFFSYLLRRSTPCTGATNGGAPDPGIYERVFTANIELYRRQRSESLSGPGSCLTQTRELRERLPLTIESLKVRSILDAPCGDFNWMQHVGLGPVEYIGVDFMAEIVAENARRHESSSRRFLRADVLGDPLPRADLVLCRDLLVHLTYADIARALRNFKASGATYLMATTFTKARQNLDTSGGEWRPLNLTDQPFNFPAPIRLVNEKCTEAGDTFDDKSLGIWRLADLPI